MTNKAKHKILFYSSNHGFIGGVERLLVALANTLKAQGWLVYGLFENSTGEDPSFDAAFEEIKIAGSGIDQLVREYRSLGIELVMTHKCSRVELLRSLQAAFPVVSLIHDHDYYCLRRHKYFPYKRINCSLPFALPWCSACSMLLEKREGTYRFINPKQRLELLRTIRQSDLSLVLSEFMAQNLIKNGWKKERIKLLVPGVDGLTSPHTHDTTSPRPDSSLKLLYVGQLIRGKGVDLLLQALAELKFDWSARIAGRGSDEGYLKTLAEELGIAGKLDFCGWQNELDALYREADLVVVPSRWQEPYGLVGLEAFAQRKAVLAFDVGGISQWLKHGKTGLLARAGDISGLARAITKLHKDPVLREKLAENAFSYLQQEHSFDKHLSSLMQPLEELIKPASGFTQQSSTPDSLDIFGIRMLNITMRAALELLQKRLLEHQKQAVWFVNADCLNKAWKDSDYHRLLRENPVVFPDGSGIMLAAKLLGRNLRENLNGTDMLPHLCELALAGSYKIFLLGAAEGVALKMQQNLVERFPGLQICGLRSGYFDWESQAEDVINQINDSGADILLVAFGAPLQERFIARFGSRIEAVIQMGVGGLFDFYSGRIPRAPLWMRRLGIEWIFRLIQEPGRMWRRYILGNPLFLYRVLKWKKSGNRLFYQSQEL